MTTYSNPLQCFFVKQKKAVREGENIHDFMICDYCSIAANPLARIYIIKRFAHAKLMEAFLWTLFRNTIWNKSKLA